MEKEAFWLDNEVKRIDKLIEGKGYKVVIPEGEDQRVIDALVYLKNIKFILLGETKKIDELVLSTYSSDVTAIKSKYTVIEPKDFYRDDLIDLFVEKRKGKLTRDEAVALIKHPNYFATLLLEKGEVNALVGGCVYSTADILKPAFQIIKPAPGNSVVSSTFILKKGDEKLLFSDCAVNINPNKDQLKEITLQTIETAKELGIKPKVALLSYSTKGSGAGEFVDLVKDTYEELIKESPELIEIVDGEFQFDAAYIGKVAKIKAPNSPVAGKANIFIFPHLLAGNIAYKIAQYLGGYEAVGPLLQGLNKPVNDLSRGADAATIAKVAYLALRNIK